MAGGPARGPERAAGAECAARAGGAEGPDVAGGIGPDVAGDVAGGIGAGVFGVRGGIRAPEPVATDVRETVLAGAGAAEEAGRVRAADVATHGAGSPIERTSGMTEELRRALLAQARERRVAEGLIEEMDASATGAERRAELRAAFDRSCATIDRLGGEIEGMAFDDGELRTETVQLNGRAVRLHRVTRPELAIGGGRGAGDPRLAALRSRTNVGRFLSAALGGGRLDGAEEELRQAVGAPERSIPFEAFEGFGPDPETRAATAAPATVGVGMDPLVPAVFAMSAAPFLGIGFERTEPGTAGVPRISTSLTAGAVAKGADQAATAAAFTVLTATPKRVSARLELTLEDVYAAGVPSFENALRENLAMVIGNALNVQLLTGDGTAPALNGLMAQLTADADPDDAQTYALASAEIAAHVEGLHARGLSDLRVLVNAAVYARLATLAATNDDSVTLLDWARRNGIEIETNPNMPASSSNVGKCIVARTAMPMGMSGAKAIIPVWNPSVLIDDPYTDSASATSSVTMHVILGDVLIRYPAAFAEWRVKTA